MKLLKLFYPNTGFLSFAIHIAINYAFQHTSGCTLLHNNVCMGRKSVAWRAGPFVPSWIPG